MKFSSLQRLGKAIAVADRLGPRWLELMAGGPDESGLDCLRELLHREPTSLEQQVFTEAYRQHAETLL